MEKQVILAIVGLEKLIIVVIVALFYMLQAWWKKKQGETEEDPQPWPGQPPRQRPQPRQPPQPGAQPPATPPARASNWEAELRRLLEGDAPGPRPPPVVISPL